MFKKLSLSTIILGCGVILVSLGLLAYLGFYNRYWADDWCYNNDFRNLGMAGTLKQFFIYTGGRGYSLNRYSLTLFSGLFYFLGIFGVQILATLTILLWLGGLYWTLSNLASLGYRLPKSLLLLISAFLLYFTLLLAPDRFQILYWRSGVLPYSAAIIAGLYIFGIVTNQMSKQTTSKAANYIIAPLAFLAGGFSEIGCVFLVSSMALLFLAACFGKRRQQGWAVKAFPSITTALVFLLLAMLALVASPSNVRYGEMNVKPNNPVLVPLLAFRYALYYVRDAIKSFPLPHLIFTTCVLILPFIARAINRENSLLGLKPGAAIIMATVIVTFLLIAAIQAPSTYFYSAPPDPRGQLLSQFTLLVGIAVMAWAAGKFVADHWSQNWLVGLTLVLLLAVYAYTARSAVITFSTELPGFVHRAQLWDERDAAIQSALAEGQTRLEVQAIDTYKINTRDMVRSKDTDKWVSNCATGYYGLESVKATMP